MKAEKYTKNMEELEEKINQEREDEIINGKNCHESAEENLQELKELAHKQGIIIDSWNTMPTSNLIK